MSGQQFLQQFVVVVSLQVLSAYQHINILTTELMRPQKSYGSEKPCDQLRRLLVDTITTIPISMCIYLIPSGNQL